jgi:transcriptional regulator with XRE-family HTH domain
MVTPETCRAARGLLDWSQGQLAVAANVGVSTIKKFETRRTVPTANNLSAIRQALEAAGVDLISEAAAGPGVMLRRLRIRAYIPNEGIHFEVRYADLDLDAPDNDFDLWFKITEPALATLAGHPIVDESDAKAVARANDARLLRTAKLWLAERGLSFSGATARQITEADLSP